MRIASRPGRLARMSRLPFRMATAPLRALPDFVIIGAQRAGTTSLYRLLSRVPGIVPASTKEVHFFDVHFGRGVGWYRSHFPIAVRRPALRQPGHGADGGWITGEATPYYLFQPAVPRRLHGIVPDAKLIVLLRNPVDRAYSHYWHARARGYETLGFEAALEAEAARLDGDHARLADGRAVRSRNHQWFSYLARGLYADQLARWLDVFPRRAFFIVASERLFGAGDGTLARLVEFLGVRVSSPLTLPRDNAGDYRAPMAEATRRRLVDYFRPHNQRLSALLGSDFVFDWDR